MTKLVAFEGKTYSFPDDATDDEIGEALTQETKKQSVGNAVAGILPSFGAETAKLVGGLERFGQDAVVAPVARGLNALMDPAGALQGAAKERVPVPSGQTPWERQAERAAQHAREQQDGKPTEFTEAVTSAGTSVLSALSTAPLGGGVAYTQARAGAPVVEALTKGFSAALKGMATGEAAKEFSEQRKAGTDVLPAAGHSAVVAAAEYFPEKWGATKLLDAVAGKNQMGRAALGFFLRDMGGEQLTTAIEDLNAWISREPNMTLDDYFRHARVTAMATLMGGPIQAGTARVSGALVERVAKKGAQQHAAGKPSGGEGSTEPPLDAGSGEVPIPVPPATPVPIDAPVSPDAPVSRVPFVVDSELPLVGLPEGNPASSGQLSLEDQLTLLRKAYEDSKVTSFQDTAEDKIRRRAEFQKRRAEVEEALRLHPEGRSLLLATDEEMGLQRPGLDVPLEVEVNDYAVLSPEQALAREALRENKRQEAWSSLPLQFVPALDAAGNPMLDEAGKALSLGQAFGITGNENPITGADAEWTKATIEMFGGKPVLRTSNPELAGLPPEEVLLKVKPEDVVYIAEPGAENTANAADMLAVLKSLKDVFLPNSSLFVGRVPVLKERIHSQAWKLPGKNIYALNMPIEFSEIDSQAREVPGSGLGDALSLQIRRSLASRMDTLIHEFVHILHFEHWKSATPEEKTAVAKEYHEDLQFALHATVQDAVQRLYSPKTAERMIAAAKAEGLNPAKELFTSPKARATLEHFALDKDGYRMSEYWFNMSEWMAHKGVKYFQTRLGVARQNVPFFRRWLAKMQAFYKHVTSKFAAPGPGFSQWLDNVALRESHGLGLATQRDITEARDRLIAAGVSPDLANLVSVVNGNRKQVLNNAVFQIEQKALTEQAEKAYESKLAEIGAPLLVEGTTLKKLEKLFENFELGRALLAAPQFSSYRTFNLGEFARSLYANVFAVGEQHSINSANFQTFTYTSPRGQMVAVYYNHATKELDVDASIYTDKAAQDSATLGAAVVTLAKLADSGVESVYINTLPPEVQRVLYGREKQKENGLLEMPYWAFEPVVEPVKIDGSPAKSAAQEKNETPNEVRLPAALHSIGAKLGVPWLSSAGNKLGRFNWLFGKALGAYELISLNADVPGMQEERTALRNRMMYRHQWLAPANERIEEWAYKLGKTEAAKLGKLLFEEAESGVWRSTKHPAPDNPGGSVYILDPAVVQKRGLSKETQELYSKIRNDLALFAEEWHKVALWEFARGELSDVGQAALHKLLQAPGSLHDAKTIVDMEITAIADPVKMQRLATTAKEINEQFTEWGKKPYMPFTRFGRYGALVRDGETGKTLYFSGHDSEAEAREAANTLQGKFPGAAISTQYMEDSVYELAGLPPAILSAMRTKLQLDPQQQETFGKVLQQLSLANSFRHHAAEKKGIEGYSEDALRAYSDYFRRGSSFMARVKSNIELADAMKLLEKHIQEESAQVGVTNVVNLRKLHEWFGRHHEYLNSSSADYGQLKSIVAMFHFAGNVSSAVMNFTQLGLATLPWLSERYGTVDATKTLAASYRDSLKLWGTKTPLTGDEQAMYEHALASGFLNESLATTIGQIADGAALTRASLVGWGAKSVGAVNHYGMWMFSTVEYLNRVSTMLAAYRLAKRDKFYGKFDENAFNFARQAVEDTQNEYAAENRPEIMRGAGGVVFQFMHYTTHMLFMQLGGDKAWWRLLIAQMLAGGLLGLPFAEDLTSFAKFLARKVDENVEPELLLREHLVALGLNQDLVARGLFSDVFGFDLSKRVSLGEVLPGMRAVGSHRQFNKALYEAVGDVGGPGVSLFVNALNFIAEEDKTAWNALRRVLPTALKNGGNAAHALAYGEVKDGSGAKVFEPDTWDVIGMAAGFQPKEASKHYLKGTLQSEQAAYWVNRKHALLETWHHVVFDRQNDREAEADFMKRLERYNREAPGKMRLTGEALRMSAVGKAKAIARKEAGLGSTTGMAESAAEISQTLEE